MYFVDDAFTQQYNYTFADIIVRKPHSIERVEHDNHGQRNIVSTS